MPWSHVNLVGINKCMVASGLCGNNRSKQQQKHFSQYKMITVHCQCIHFDTFSNLSVLFSCLLPSNIIALPTYIPKFLIIRRTQDIARLGGFQQNELRFVESKRSQLAQLHLVHFMYGMQLSFAVVHLFRFRWCVNCVSAQFYGELFFITILLNPCTMFSTIHFYRFFSALSSFFL